MAIKFFKDNKIKDLSNIGYLALATILDRTYPVGCYFETSDVNFNPNEEFVGEWVEDTKGQVMMSRNPNSTVESYREAGNNVGNYNITLTVDNLPSHNHSVGAHAHGLNSHTHTYAKSNTSTGSTVLTVNQIPSHNHKNKTYGLIRAAEEASGYTAGTGYGFRDRLVVTSKSSSTLLIATGGGQGHTHTIRTTPTNSGAATGSTANSTAFNSGNTGSGQQFSVVQYSKTCVRWHRIS